MARIWRALVGAVALTACVAGSRAAGQLASEPVGGGEVLVVSIGAERAGCPPVRLQLAFPLEGGAGEAHQEMICADGRRRLDWTLRIQPIPERAWRLTISSPGGEVRRDLSLDKNDPVFQLDELQVAVSVRTEHIDGSSKIVN